MSDHQRPQGFTLIELLVAMVIFSIVGSSVYQVLVRNQRTYAEQSERVAMNANVRNGLSLLTSELREINPGDSLGSDIISMSSTAIRYKAMRSLYFLCQAPDTINNIVYVWDTQYGLRDLDVSLDSVVVFADNDPNTRSDDRWIHANATSIASGNVCPGASAGQAIRLSGVSAPGVTAVLDGAPLRSFSPVEFGTMTSGSDTYLGYRSWSKSGGWTGQEQVLGPLSSLTFSFYDTAGAVTATAADVSLIEIDVEAQTEDPVRLPDGSMGHATTDLTMNVAVRNVPRY